MIVTKLLDLFVEVSVKGVRTVAKDLAGVEKSAERTNRALEETGREVDRLSKKSVTLKTSLKGDGQVLAGLNAMKDRTDDLDGANVTMKTTLSGSKGVLSELDRIDGVSTRIDGDTVTIKAQVSGGEQGRAQLSQLEAAASKIDGNQVTMDAEVTGAGSAIGELTALERLRASVDGKEVNVSADFDAGAATAKMLAFQGVLTGVKTAASGMGEGLSAGGIRIMALGGIATAAAALFTPLLAGLATVGSLGASAAAGFGLIGAAAALMIQQVKAGNPAFMDLKRAYEDIKASFEDAFMPAAKSLAALSTEVLKFAGSYLPRLGRAAKANVGALKVGVEDFMRILKQPVQNASFNTLLKASVPIVRNLTVAAGRLTAGLVNVFAAASPWAVKLSGFLRQITTQFLKWSASQSGINAIRTAVAQSVPVFSALWRMVKNVVGALLSFGANNAGSIAQAIDIISAAVGGAIRVFGRLIGAIGPFGVVIAALMPVVAGLALIFGQVFAVIAPLLPAFGAIAGVLSGPVVLAIAAAVAAGVLLVRNWSTVKGALASVATQIRGFVKVVANIVRGTDDFTGSAQRLTPAVARMAVAVGRGLRGLATAARAAFNGLRNGARQMWAQVKPILSAVESGIQKGLVTALRFLIPQVKQFVDNFRRGFAQIKAAVLPVLTAIGKAIRTVAGTAFEFLISQAKVVVRWFQQNWPLIRETALTVFNAVKRGVGNAITNTAKVVRAVWGRSSSGGSRTTRSSETSAGPPGTR